MAILRHTAAALLLVACNNGNEPEPEPDTGPDEVGTRTIELVFDAVIGDQAFDCVTEYRTIGLGGAGSITLKDLKLFVSNVALTTTTGDPAFVELEASSWSGNGVTLLDFEDATFQCAGGTEATNMVVRGTVPDVDYTGVSFTIGVPEELNHTDVAAAAPPLDAEAMFRDVLQGYWFFHLDMKTGGEPDGYPIFVGSSGCSVDMDGVLACDAENRVSFSLLGLDPDTHVVNLDLQKLLITSDVNNNTTEPGVTKIGCQSDVSDKDCQDFWPAYGLSPLPPEWVSAVPKPTE